MEKFEALLRQAAPTPAFIPEGLAFERIMKNETAVVGSGALGLKLTGGGLGC